MKNLKLTLLALLAIASSTQCAELYLNKINNKTLHKIQWEKLPLPGMLGKMRPEMISRFGSSEPKMPIIPPATLSFKNPTNPKQAVLIGVTLARRTLKGGRDFRKDPKKLEYLELYVVLKDPAGKILERWPKRIKPSSLYKINVELKGNNLQKTEIQIIEKLKAPGLSTWDV